MKIILVDEEAHHYMDMRDDIYSLNQRITELEHTIAQYAAMLTPAEEEPTPSYEDYASQFDASTHDYPEGVTREEHTAARWSDYDRARITSRIFLTGTYYGSDREFSTIRALFPERTEAAVKSMIYTLGGICKKGIVHPRIQPKQKENNA
jgi:hypothetical protein